VLTYTHPENTQAKQRLRWLIRTPITPRRKRISMQCQEVVLREIQGVKGGRIEMGLILQEEGRAEVQVWQVKVGEIWSVELALPRKVNIWEVRDRLETM